MWTVCPSWEERLPFKRLLQVSTPPASVLKRNLLINLCTTKVNMVTVVRRPNFAVLAVRRIAREVVVDKQSELAKYILNQLRKAKLTYVNSQAPLMCQVFRCYEVRAPHWLL